LLLAASVVIALSIAVIWFRAPLLPALVGACGTGLYLYWRQKNRPGA
jgi:hypothetical protein